MTTLTVSAPPTAREVSKVAGLLGVDIEHFYRTAATSYYDAWKSVEVFAIFFELLSVANYLS